LIAKISIFLPASALLKSVVSLIKCGVISVPQPYMPSEPLVAGRAEMLIEADVKPGR
jgi:hypothetical protein